jgi:RNA polymerase sigma factor (TIGR02999 family)
VGFTLLLDKGEISMSNQDGRQEGRVGEITRLLVGLSSGDQAAGHQVITLLYKDLRRLARYYWAKERRDHTLQPTALVHEAYVRMSRKTGVKWQNRGHFFAAAAREMRRILIDHARRANAVKRAAPKVSLKSALVSPEESADLLLLHESLNRLATWDARQAQIVEMRFFGGLSIEEIAVALEVSVRTVKRDWNVARAWLYAELTKATPDDGNN